LLVSLAVHGLLAVGLIAYLAHSSELDVAATLDLSSVELSFAEEVDERSAVSPMPPAPPPKPVRPVTAEEKPPEPKAEKLLAPDPAAAKFREPKDENPEFKPPVPAAPQPQTSNLKPQTAASAAPQQAKIDAPPLPKRSIRPDYPKGARQRGEQGDVVLEIRVGKDGSVESAAVVRSSGFAELDEAAVKAARGTKFAPARSGREAVPSTARMTLSFRLKM